MNATTVGIVTALPLEQAAVEMFVDNRQEHGVPGDPNRYVTGSTPSSDPGRPHAVVVGVQVHDGTRNAAALCTDMVRSFPTLRAIVMCGVAGGVPSVAEPLRHVRCGDIVVATRGVVDYDHVRSVAGVDSPRRPVPGPSPDLLRADHALEVGEFRGEEPWHELLLRAVAANPRFARPPEGADVLYVNGRPAAHPEPERSGHRRGLPRVHRGAIGSADRLLRDAVRRDALARLHGILAVEMEASGIAVAAELHGRPWFMVRGIADYCDDRKDKTWQPYAALAAAAYVRALLNRCPPLPARHGPPLTPRTPGIRPDAAASRPSGEGRAAIVDALLTLSPMRDDYQRRAVLSQLPAQLRVSVPDSVSGRLHVVALVSTCEDYPDGREALIGMLRAAFGAESPELARVEDVIRTHWP